MISREFLFFSRIWICLVLSFCFFLCHNVVASDEKLLLSFEKDELQELMSKAKNKTYSFFEEQGEQIRFLEKSWGYGDWVNAKPLVAVKNKATHGEYALRTIVGLCNTMDAVLMRAGLDIMRTDAVLSTFTLWERGSAYDSLFPRDWSGFPVLRMDLFVERKNDIDTYFCLDISDDIILPPVTASYTVPANKWITLEFDIDRAVKERILQQDKICFVLLRLHERQKSEVPANAYRPESVLCYLDNIRLAKREAKIEHPVLRDEKSFKLMLPGTYAVVYETVPDPKDSKRSGLRWKPCDLTMPMSFAGKVIPPSGKLESSIINLPDYGGEWLNSLSVCGGAARDGKRIVIALSGALTAHIVPPTSLQNQCNGVSVYVTSDGGTTWTGVEGTYAPTAFLQGHHAPGWTVTIGGELFGFVDFGCFNTGWSYPIDKGFCRRIKFTADEKWWMSPYYFVDPHGQHCINQQTAVIDRSGRIWTAWTQLGINGTDLCLSWSDDGGATWHGCQGDDRLPRVPGLKAGHVCLVPFGQGVALFSRASAEYAMWVIFDGKTWSEPDKYPSAYGQQIVSVADDEIYLCAPNKEPPAVIRFDGKSWKEELKLPTKADKQVRTVPQLSICGKTVLCFTLDSTRTKLLYYRKIEGQWSQPVELVTESTPIVSFVSQQYALPDFTPLAYMCAEEEQKIQEGLKASTKPSELRAVHRIKQWVKLLKVSALP